MKRQKGWGDIQGYGERGERKTFTQISNKLTKREQYGMQHFTGIIYKHIWPTKKTA